ncbi:LysR substrate-binding domain-containing protein [Burkholderia cepacia]|uniref:LysR substrate-binding domain-containing protein n=1 Tax=Burkholderia cepacia TaxID=292 RepID=UPI002AB65B7E|nr:LysR substrate-binding domain-containing protein [Burkholderia cepacia]
MNTSCRSSSLTLAASRGALSPQLANLLALQRAEEPETPVLLVEAQPEDIFQGLMDRRYDLGIAWMASAKRPLSIQPLWQDELAVAMPVRSPLLQYRTISPAQLHRQQLFYWCPQDCESLKLPADGLLTATSFALMAVYVAAGYGLGIAPRSRIVQARSLGIAMRPLGGSPHRIQTDLVRHVGFTDPATERFAMRARRVAESVDPLATSRPASPGTPP